MLHESTVNTYKQIIVISVDCSCFYILMLSMYIYVCVCVCVCVCVWASACCNLVSNEKPVVVEAHKTEHFGDTIKCQSLGLISVIMSIISMATKWTDKAQQHSDSIVGQHQRPAARVDVIVE